MEYGKPTMEQASCILATGVKLSRMTEPGDEEWWLLADSTKKSLESLRERWDSTPQFDPRVYPFDPHVKKVKTSLKVKTFSALPPSTVSKVSIESKLSESFLISLQILSERVVLVPALSLYDSARSHMAKGLSAGGITALWNQFPTGKLEPMGYGAFRQVFGSEIGWHKYRPWAPPSDSALILHRPEGRLKKQKSLSYEYSELASVSLWFIVFFLCCCRYLTRKWDISLDPTPFATGVILGPLSLPIPLYQGAQSAWPMMRRQRKSNLFPQYGHYQQFSQIGSGQNSRMSRVSVQKSCHQFLHQILDGLWTKDWTCPLFCPYFVITIGRQNETTNFSNSFLLKTCKTRTFARFCSTFLPTASMDLRGSRFVGVVCLQFKSCRVVTWISNTPK